MNTELKTLQDFKDEVAKEQVMRTGRTYSELLGHWNRRPQSFMLVIWYSRQKERLVPTFTKHMLRSC